MAQTIEVVKQLEQLLNTFENYFSTRTFWWFSNTDNEMTMYIPIFRDLKSKRIEKLSILTAISVIKTQLPQIEEQFNAATLNRVEFERALWNVRIISKVIEYLLRLRKAFLSVERALIDEAKANKERGGWLRREYNKLLEAAEEFWVRLQPRENSPVYEEFTKLDETTPLEKYHTLLELCKPGG